MSIIQTYQPPVMEVTEDTIPELQPIFSLLNHHSNKLYHEGYFLKLDDQNTRTWRPSNPLSPTLWLHGRLLTLTFRGQTEPRQNMGRMLRAACRHCALIMGRCRAGRCG